MTPEQKIRMNEQILTIDNAVGDQRVYISYEDRIEELEEQVRDKDESLQVMHKRLADADNRIEEVIKKLKQRSEQLFADHSNKVGNEGLRRGEIAGIELALKLLQVIKEQQ